MIGRVLDESDTDPSLSAYHQAMEITRLPVSRDVAGLVTSIRLHAPEPGRNEQHLGLPGASAQLRLRSKPNSTSEYEIYVTGVRTRARRKPAGADPALTVRFQPGAARTVLGIPVEELADSVVSIDQVWPADADRLRQQLAEAASIDARARIVELAIQSRASRCGRRGPVAADLVRRAARAVQMPRPLPSVTELARTLNVGERRLHRAFLDAAGIAPKTYLRAVRLRRAVALAPGRPWSVVAIEAGYYDQSHMIDEFHALVGTTPASFVSEIRRQLDAHEVSDLVEPSRSPRS